LGRNRTGLVADPKDVLPNPHSVFQTEEILVLFSTNSWLISKSDRPTTILWHIIHKRRNPVWLLYQPYPICMNPQKQELKAGW